MGTQSRRAMPPQRPGKSKQDYGTPRDFLDAAKRKLGIMAFGLDLAATAKNTTARRYFSSVDDAFEQASWKARGESWSWLNPPFGDIAQWAERCALEAREHGAKIAFLVPASVGSNWWAQHVHRQADVCRVLFLNGRITFVGHEDPYPKDLALVLYQDRREDDEPMITGAPKISYDCWRWQS